MALQIGVIMADVVRVSVDVCREPGGYVAAVNRSDGMRSYVNARATTKTLAIAALAEVIAHCVEILDQSGAIVIGGDGDYADAIHVVIPGMFGFSVHAVRGGRHVCTWLGVESTTAEAIDHVVRMRFAFGGTDEFVILLVSAGRDTRPTRLLFGGFHAA